MNLPMSQFEVFRNAAAMGAVTTPDWDDFIVITVVDPTRYDPFYGLRRVVRVINLKDEA